MERLFTGEVSIFLKELSLAVELVELLNLRIVDVVFFRVI